jgi:hypothetical protein
LTRTRQGGCRGSPGPSPHLSVVRWEPTDWALGRADRLAGGVGPVRTSVAAWNSRRTVDRLSAAARAAETVARGHGGRCEQRRGAVRRPKLPGRWAADGVAGGRGGPACRPRASLARAPDRSDPADRNWCTRSRLALDEPERATSPRLPSPVGDPGVVTSCRCGRRQARGGRCGQTIRACRCRTSRSSCDW